MSPDEELLQEIIDRIVRAVQPERVIMFGSAARGEMDSNRYGDSPALVYREALSRGRVVYVE